MVKKINFKNQIFRKKELKEVIHKAFTTYGINRAALLADDLKNLGFSYATNAGISLSIEDLKIPPTKKELLSFGANEILKLDLFYMKGKINNVERFQKIINIWNQISEILKSNLISFFETTDPFNSIYLMAFSGARGNLSQVRQLVAMRGLMSDPNGKIIDIPIIHNFREGLTITDYLISSYGARKGVVDTALRTADSGYLTRRLVDVAQTVIIREYDCKTKRSITIYNKGKNLFFLNKILGRTIAENLYSKNLPDFVIFKNNIISSDFNAKILNSDITSIKVYSPLTCESTRSICQKCYGLDLSNFKIIALGNPIGIIAAQSIGEPGTQLTMRTFHTGGIFTSDLSRQIVSKLNGLFYYDNNILLKPIRTLDGNYFNNLEREGIFRIITYTNIQNLIKLPADTLLFIKNKSFIKKGDLIAELPSKDQQMLKSKKDILSPHSGEVIFSLEKNIIWILEGDVYNIPFNSFFNEFKFNQIINFYDNLIFFKLINKKPGIIKILKDYLFDSKNIIKISNCLEFFKYFSLFWDKKKRKLVLFFESKKQNFLYLLQPLLKQSKTNQYFFANYANIKYQTLTGGKIFISHKNNIQSNSIYGNQIIIKNCKILFIPIELFVLNKDKSLFLVKNNSKLAKIDTELFPGIFSRTNGFIQIKESSHIIHEVKIKPGDFFEFKKLNTIEIKQLEFFDKKIYFPGEVIFGDIFIRYLTLVEIIKTKFFYAVILRPIYEFNIPKSKNLIKKEKKFLNINVLNFSLQTYQEIKSPLNLIQNQLWHQYNKSQYSFLRYQYIKMEKFIETNLIMKKFTLQYYKDLYNFKQKRLFLKWSEKKIYYFGMIDEEKFNINQILPKKLNSEKLKISFFIKDLEYVEKKTIIGKISLIANNNSKFKKLKIQLIENFRIILIREQNYQTYFNDIYLYIQRKNRFITIGNKIAPLVKIKTSGKIDLIKSFKLIIHKGTPFFITSLTKLYVKLGKFVKQDEILGIISYKQIITGDIVQGLPKIEEILEARKGKTSAFLMNNPGVIKKIEKFPKMTVKKIFIYENKNKNSKNFLNRIKKEIIIKKNQFIYLGQALNEGSINPHNLLRIYFSFYIYFLNEFEAAYLSFKNLQFLLIEKVQQIYITQGVTISDKHLEIIIKKITSKIQITHPGDSSLLPYEILELKQIKYINKILKKAQKKEVLFQPILVGITKSSLLNDSFISAASFQETTKILTAAAIEGKIDWVKGLKENVIIGRLIPVGTGFKK